MWQERPLGTRGCAWSRGAGSVLHRPGYFGMGNGGWSAALQAVEAVGGAEDAGGAAVEDVGVDHRGGDVAVAEELLDGADVVRRLRGGGWRRSGGRCGRWRAWGCPVLRTRFLHRALQDGFVEVVAAALVGLAVEVGAGGGEDPLPDPLAAGAGVLAGERPGSSTQPAPARRSASCWSRTVSRCLARSRLAAAGSIVTRSLSPLPERTVIWLRAKSTSFTRRRRAFQQPQAGAVEQQGHEAGRAVERVEDGLHLVAGEHDREPLAASWRARCRRATAAPARAPRDRGRAARSAPGSAWRRPRCAGRPGRSGSA